ncbi:MAG: hypothetical protein K0Q50_754 [Vampirovibrio sp.]|jgi:putative SOS response-associated peptidase YedK|nr:hypothetical protein [Vampirovibrio sp.]
MAVSPFYSNGIMCGGMEYRYTDPVTGEVIVRKAFFPIPKVKIPVITEEGPVFCQWGKRQGEDPEFDVPVTGWARLLSLKEGKWNRYQPRRVKVPALRWMEKDSQRQSHWFDLDPAQSLLGVLIEQRDERFVYIVTRPAETHFAEVHNRMPLLINV